MCVQDFEVVIVLRNKILIVVHTIVKNDLDLCWLGNLPPKYIYLPRLAFSRDNKNRGVNSLVGDTVCKGLLTLTTEGSKRGKVRNPNFGKIPTVTKTKRHPDKYVAINTIFEVMEDNREDFKEHLQQKFKNDATAFYDKFVVPIQPKDVINVKTTNVNMNSTVESEKIESWLEKDDVARRTLGELYSRSSSAAVESSR